MRNERKEATRASFPWPIISATSKVTCSNGKVYFESCGRCDGYPIINRLAPTEPMTEGLMRRLIEEFHDEPKRSRFGGYYGGGLPVYTADGSVSMAACNCEIGRLRHEQYGWPFYDSLAGSDLEDTKHDLVMARFQGLTKKTAKEAAGRLTSGPPPDPSPDLPF